MTTPSKEWKEWQENFLTHIGKWTYFSAKEELQKGFSLQAREIIELAEGMILPTEGLEKEVRHQNENANAILSSLISKLKEKYE